MTSLMLPLKNLTVFTLLALFLLGSCKKTDVKEEQTAGAPAVIAGLKTAIAQATGAPLEQVVYSKETEEFIIEEDTYLTLADAKMRFGTKGEGTPSGVNGTSQMLNYFIVDPEKVSAIQIYVDPSVPNAWKEALDQAIENWNATGSSVFMERVEKAKWTATKITAYYNPYSRTIATASLPDYYGAPGRRVCINTLFNGLAESKKVFALTHELGHTVGFNHTNGNFGYLIEGTPEDDAGSVMNSVCQEWSGFSENDLFAIKYTYPSSSSEGSYESYEWSETYEP